MKKISCSIVVIISFLFLNCTSKQETASNNQNAVNDASGKVNRSDSKTKISDKDEIIIKTSDDKELSTNYFYSSGQKETLQPLVVLIHQFNQSKEQWKQDFVDSLLNAGYKVLAYDIRGHGKSSNVSYSLDKLLTDPVEAPNDVIAVFSWAKSQKGIDSSRIAVMGTSIGGNLACYAKARLGAKTAISISNGKDTFEKYLNIDERIMNHIMVRIPSIYIICGNKDGSRAEDSKFLMDNYIDDPKELKIYDSDKHGMYLMEQFPEIQSLALNWLKKYL